MTINRHSNSDGTRRGLCVRIGVTAMLACGILALGCGGEGAPGSGPGGASGGATSDDNAALNAFGSASGSASGMASATGVNFQAAGTYAAQAATSMASSDLNGDGKADLVVGSGNGSVLVLVADASGKLTSHAEYTVGSDVSAIAITDVNEDGHADILATSSGSGTLTVLHGNGSGSFSLAGQYAAGSAPFAIAIHDFDGDGRADVAIAARGNNSIHLLMNGVVNGAATLEAGKSFAFSSQIKAIAAADLNGDGHADLIASLDQKSGDSQIGVLFGDGKGSFSALLDADGKVDASLGSLMLSGSLVGQLLVTAQVDDGKRADIVIADFNSDGKADFAVANSSISGAAQSDLTTFVANADSSFTSTAQLEFALQAEALVTADFNGDGKADLATAMSDVSIVGAGHSDVGLMLGDGKGHIAAAGGAALALRYASSMVAGDFNGDGRIDLAIASAASSSITILLNTAASADTTIH